MTDFEKQLLIDKQKTDNKTKVLIAIIWALALVLSVAILVTGHYTYEYLANLVIEYEYEDEYYTEAITDDGGDALIITGDNNKTTTGNKYLGGEEWQKQSSGNDAE